MSLNGLDNLINFFVKKKIVIWGFGKEGASSYKFLRTHLSDAIITIIDTDVLITSKHNYLISDLKNKRVKIFHQNKNEIAEIKTSDYTSIEKELISYDIILKSPGIKIDLEKIKKNIGLTNSQKIKNKIYSQAALFIQFFGDQCIGITGTKGKSTTSKFTYLLANEFGLKSFFIGNIGLPFFDILSKENINLNVDDKFVYILELSSFQLEYIKHSPVIATILNLFHDHLDFHGNEQNYWNAKKNITRYQQSQNLLIISEQAKKNLECNQSNVLKNKKIEIIKDDHWHLRKILQKFDIKYSQKIKKVIKENEQKIIGEHNFYNFYVAIQSIKKFIEIKNYDINFNKMIENAVLNTLKKFKPLPHRLEYVGEYKNIKFYNDSISTIPESVIAAVNTLLIKNEKIDYLIIGGKDRNINYHNLCKIILSKRIKNIYLIAETGKKIYAIFKILNYEQTNSNYLLNIKYLSNIQTTLLEIKKNSLSEGICLLSPGASSFDQFKNYEERGNYYKKQVKKLFK